MKCPKSIEVRDQSYPYGAKTRFCPFRHYPCVLETDDADKCGIAGLLLATRDTIAQVFDSTCEIKGLHECLRANAEVSMNVELAAEKVVEVVYEDLGKFLN